MKDASEVYLATDEDREGESIAWHLLEVLSPQVPVHRMVFHEITRAAIEAALANPASSTGASSMPKKRAGFLTASMAMRSRPCCGER